ncbi:uncharacterized mitochondrial protein AtMg00810-like [Mangifera indica]|uniref:uncharacterized mitochondrial protein AtMg00810-like n=1 Tax=Mangifera indica TaxID=29780 RepID=UPI001CFA17D9|nr:uncharacterized mitochondrial protein AtMg00810-like [Mangifera indica]
MGLNSALVEEFKSNMMGTFEMTDLGLLQYFMGLEIFQDEDGVFIFQKKYVTNLLKKFNMSNCKMMATPMNKNQKLKQQGVEAANQRQFRSLVGGLIYLIHTRPDISFSIGVVSRFMSNQSKQHYGGAKRILRYIAGILNYGM